MPDETWGTRLRRLREAQKMSRVELAEACTRLGRRTARNDIVRYEENAYFPRLPTFAALAEALGVSLDVLWYGEEKAEQLAWQREQQ
jgi:transcriptional regulator with XRE-family HTH domain